MNDLVTIITTGRVTADLELKTSQNGKNTKYIQFGLAVNKGYGDNEHPNFYSCVLYGESAQRMIDAKVKKGSLIQIIGDQELVEFTRKDGSTGWLAKITILNWNYGATNKPKESNTTDDVETDETGFVDILPCGDNGLPFD